MHVQTLYTVAVVTDEGTYEVHRRYSEFRALRDAVRRALPSEPLPRLPPKKVNPLRDNFSRTFLQVTRLDDVRLLFLLWFALSPLALASACRALAVRTPTR